MKIALITYLDKGNYASLTNENEDDTLLNFLEDKGLSIEKVIWNDPKINWENYDLAILKSPWDYFDFIEEFYLWLSMLKSKQIRLLNPIDIVKWNADKHYLHDIEKAGLNVTPSIFISKGETLKLADYFQQLTTTKFIIKPAISGGSKNTFKVTAGNVAEVSKQMEGLIGQEDFIVQPFLTEIEENGEWSFLFFGGKFSHALLKKAKMGDFRVQHSFGGTVHPQNPSPDLLAAAQRYVDLFAKDCLYARVDGAIVNNELMLMELELIEPYLFLGMEIGSLESYYQALLKLIKV